MTLSSADGIEEAKIDFFGGGGWASATFPTMPLFLKTFKFHYTSVQNPLTTGITLIRITTCYNLEQKIRKLLQSET